MNAKGGSFIYDIEPLTLYIVEQNNLILTRRKLYRFS